MILIVTQTFAPATGGMEAYMTGLADHLAEGGKKVVVLADASVKNASAFAPHAPYTLRRFGGFRPWRRWTKSRAVAALTARETVEGIFCDSWKSVEAIPRGVAVPIAVLAHGSEYPPAPTAKKRRRIAAALTRSRSIIANSRFTADAVRAFLPQKDDPRLSLILPPIAPLPPPTAQAQQDLRAVIGQRHPVLSTLARLEPRKGVDSVIEALPRLRALFPDIVLLIGGDGADQERLQALAQERGVAAHVEFLGTVKGDRKSALLAASDVFAMPTRRVGTSVEGFGIVYTEAAWFGVPALGSRGNGAADAIVDGETGLLCDGENQADITATLARLLTDKETSRALGRAAQTRARRDLTWDRAGPRFLAALGLSS